MLANDIRAVTRRHGPFASVYFDGYDPTDSGELTEVLVHRVVRELRRLGCDQRLTNVARAAVDERPGWAGSRGRAVIATAAGVVVDAPVRAGWPAPLVRVSRHPFLLPLLTERLPGHLFVAVDRLGADVVLHRGDTVWAETIEPERDDVHVPATAGFNGVNDLHPRIAEAIRINTRAVADRVVHLADHPDVDVVVVSGPVEPRSDLVAELPPRIAAKVTPVAGGPRGRRATERERRTEVDAALRACLDDRMSGLLSRFERERGEVSGLAVQGLDDVCAALRVGNVDTLLVGKVGDATVFAGTGAMVAAQPQPTHGGEMAAARADEALPFAALAGGADVVDVGDSLHVTDGVAGVLRYPTASPPS